MGEYLRPDVYIEERSNSAGAIESLGTATGGFIGLSPKGDASQAIFITSWNDFCLKFARGVTAFRVDADLAYAVKGFFENGGGRAWVKRMVGPSALKATVKVPVSTGADINAIDEGVWANALLEVTVAANTTPANTFNVTVEFDGIEVEYFEIVSNTTTDDYYFGNVITGVSKWIEIPVGEVLAAGTGVMAAGASDETSLTDVSFVDALAFFDVVDDINLIAIPGKTSDTIVTGLFAYTDGRKDCFAIIDAQLAQTAANMVTNRADYSGTYGAIYYPWIKVDDPLSLQGRMRLCPPCGHIMGIYARTDEARGVHKAPAGLEAVIRGARELELALSNGDVELLNPLGVNCLISKRNVGIVVWGARTLSVLAEKRYVTDVRLDANIAASCYRGTQWAVFEPNDETMWLKLANQIKAFLYTKWREGAFFGTTPEEAYYVKCDAELNPEEIRNAGRVIAEIGYAKKKPAEFVILVFSQKTTSVS